MLEAVMSLEIRKNIPACETGRRYASPLCGEYQRETGNFALDDGKAGRKTSWL